MSFRPFALGVSTKADDFDALCSDVDGLSLCSGVEGLSLCSDVEGLSVCSGVEGLSFCSAVDGLSLWSDVSGLSLCSDVDGLSLCSGVEGLSLCSGVEGLSLCSGVEGLSSGGERTAVEETSRGVRNGAGDKDALPAGSTRPLTGSGEPLATSGPAGCEDRLAGDGDRLAGCEDRFAGSEDRLAGDGDLLVGSENRLAGGEDRPVKDVAGKSGESPADDGPLLTCAVLLVMDVGSTDTIVSATTTRSGDWPNALSFVLKSGDRPGREHRLDDDEEETPLGGEGSRSVGKDMSLDTLR